MTSPGRSVQALILARRAASLRGIRDDVAGPFLARLVNENGGVGALAKLLGWHRTTLQLLMRTPSRVPKTSQRFEDLAQASGNPVEEIRRIFGRLRNPANQKRTAAILAAVRQRFPGDSVKLAVVDRIEREHTSLHAYSTVLDIDKQGFRLWLTGEHKGIEEASLWKIVKHEGIHVGKRWVKTHSAEANLHRHLARYHRKLGRRKHIRRSERHRQAISVAKRKQWAPNSPWRIAKGNNILAALFHGQKRARAEEEKSLVGLIRLAVGKFRSQHRNGAKPADALRVLCRIALQHGRRFSSSSLTFEELPEKIAKEMGAPLHAILHINGHPYDVQKIAVLIRVRADSPPQVWREVGAQLYGDPDKGEIARDLWHQIRDTLPPALLRRLVEAVLGASASPNRVQNVLRLTEGRPRKTPLTPA